METRTGFLISQETAKSTLTAMLIRMEESGLITRRAMSHYPIAHWYDQYHSGS